MRVALITLSREGALLVSRLVRDLPDSHPFVHANVEVSWECGRFGSIRDLTGRIFYEYQGLVYIAPCGVVVRAVAPYVKHKTTDPAVVVVDVGARWAVSLLSGHEGHANDLAVQVSNILSAEPVISTTTEALKDLIVGIGCRKNTASEKIVDAVSGVLEQAGSDISHVRMLSSADIKAHERGLLLAALELGVPLRFISSDEIRNSTRTFQESDLTRKKVDLPAVAEPCALLAGRRTRLIVPRRIYNGVTVAVAREGFLS